MRDLRSLSARSTDDLGRIVLELRQAARELEKEYPRDEVCRSLAKVAYQTADTVADARSDIVLWFTHHETYRRRRANVIPFPRRKK